MTGMAGTNVLSADISSGGVTAGAFDGQLQACSLAEISWRIQPEPTGAAVLNSSRLTRDVFSAISQATAARRVDAISVSCFMHSSVLLDDEARALTPVFTWLDARGAEGVEYLRREIGNGFYERTGCRFHPMFPVFKLAAMSRAHDPILTRARTIASAKAVVMHELTGVWAEDHGTASASGLYGLKVGDWDSDLLRLAGVQRDQLPAIVERDAVVGRVTKSAAERHSLPEGVPVVAGSGDGFLANLASGCDRPGRISVTLGTSGSVRRTVSAPKLDLQSGAFCYRAGAEAYLLGCATNNGGNVFEWSAGVFGDDAVSQSNGKDAPIFIPTLYGERSPDWDASLSARWCGVRPHHTRADLARSVVEGVVFNMAHYVETIQNLSGEKADLAVISGNGFLREPSAGVLASLLDAAVIAPSEYGLGSLRGAAICGFQGVGRDPAPAIESLIDSAALIQPLPERAELRERYARYREIRAGGGNA